MTVLQTGDAIGFLGLGAMGGPMSACAAKAGFKIKGFDIAETARQRFSEATGTKAVGSVAEACTGVKAVITMLADGKTVRQALLGDGAPAKAAERGTLFIDMSSSSPVDTRSLGPDLQALGMDLVDAPVSGGTIRAKDGSLAIMAGGSPEALEKAMPLLKTMGANVFATGALGCGHAMKALNNFLAATSLAASLEALVIGREFGLEPQLMLDVVNASSGRNAATEGLIKNQVLSGKFSAGFALRLMAKDTGIAADLARHAGFDGALPSSVAKRWQDAHEKLPGDADMTAFFKFAESQLGRR